MRKRAVVAMGGGPTRVINQTLYGIASEAGRNGIELWAARHGIDGILSRTFTPVGPRTPMIARGRRLPGACIGSTRTKPDAQMCEKVLRILTDNDVHFLFYIGGNDTSAACATINEGAKRLGYELRTFHVPKTIDNDLVKNDHTPGYGSAARYVAHAVLGDDLDVASIPGIKIDVVMGRDAGWLTAASALCKTDEAQGPHLIYLPERPKTLAAIVEDILAVYDRYQRAVVCVAEGLKGTDNEPFLNSPALRAEVESGPYRKLKTAIDALERFQKVGGVTMDPFGHPQLSGTGALADFLSTAVKVAFRAHRIKLNRVRADTLGYPQRAYAGDISAVDAREAEMVGREAVRIAASGDVDGSISLQADRSGGRYRSYVKLIKLSHVAGKVRRMPAAYINRAGNFVTKRYLDYVRPLVGSLARE